MDKEILIKNFSRYARLYDNYADVQKKAAAELLARIKGNGFTEILELGCGIGNYTEILRKKFKDAKIKALDICPQMLKIAQEKLKDKEVEFILADAEAISLKGNFELITSNACFQWFGDLDATLAKYKNLLKSAGTITFSAFGPQTFQELSGALKYLLKDALIEADKFKTLDELRNILHKNFTAVKMEEIRYTEIFSSLKDLLIKIKYTGVRGNGMGNKIYFSRTLLKRLEETYLNKFKQIKATYQVFFCRGKKR